MEKIADARATRISGNADLVRLRGTVTAFSGWKNSFFLQDASGSISVDRLETAAVHPGDEVEVVGHLQPGLFANIVLSESAVVLGHGALPLPRPVSYQDLQTGAFDSTLVQVEGTVHAARHGSIWGRSMLFLDVQMGTAAITAYLLNDTAAGLESLVDSRVRITGVCGTIFNSRRQLIGLRLFVDGLKQVQVLAKGVDPSLIPVSPIESLLTFKGPPLDHRVHVKGTVTYVVPGKELFLQEGQSATRILNPVGEILKPGVRAEAWGFVANRGYSPELENAFVKALGNGDSLDPIRIQGTDAIKSENGFLQAPYDALLVQIAAKVVDRLPNTGALLWTLEANGVRFQAEIAGGPRDWALAFESGAEVMVSGICVAEIDQTKDLNSFHILLRSPADMVVSREPYWNQSLLLLLVTYLSILVGSLAVYGLQKRQFARGVVSVRSNSSQRTEEICRRAAKVLALVALLQGVAIFSLALTRITHPLSASSSVSASGLNSGPLLALAALTLLLTDKAGRAANVLRVAGQWLVVVTGAVVLTGGPFLTGVWGLVNVEQMSLSTELSLVLVGCAALWTRSKRLADTGQVLAVMVAFTALLKLANTLYGAGTGIGLAAHLSMSTPSALAFLCLSVALLLASPEHGLMKTICSPRLGGLVLRRLIPAAVIVPIVLGFVRLQLQLLGLIDTRFGLTLFAVSNVLCFCFLIWTSGAILNRLDGEKSKAEEGLRERERKLELVFETGSLGDWVWNLADGMIYAHSSVWRLYGEPDRRGSEHIEWFRRRIHPEDQARVSEELAKAQAKNCPLGVEFRIIWPDGSVHWDYCRAVPVADENGELAQIIGIDLDITRQKMAETSLQHSLDEKNALLQEVHHRVKNNLCIISSLLSMQAEALENREAVAKLQDSRERVLSMARIHEQLYRHEDMSSIDLAAYVSELASQLFSTYAVSPLVTYRLETEPAILSIEQSIPCGLILNELITNALKYAYPEGDGEILIQVGTQGDEVWFTVADKGVGLPKGFNLKESKSLGMQIIEVLAEQLDGHLEVSSQTAGASFTVRFVNHAATMAVPVN